MINPYGYLANEPGHADICNVNRGLSYACSCYLHPGRTKNQFDSLSKDEQAELYRAAMKLIANAPGANAYESIKVDIVKVDSVKIPIDHASTGGKMSTVNICDRDGCGAMVKGLAIGRVGVATGSDGSAEQFGQDLCPACIQDVMTLLESAPVTPRERAYSKPWFRTTDPADTPAQLALETRPIGDLVKETVTAVMDALDARRVETQAPYDTGRGTSKAAYEPIDVHAPKITRVDPNEYRD